MRISLAAVMIVCLAGCASGPSGNRTGSAREMNDPRASLYKGKCIACHILPEPGDYDDEEWSEILEDHQKRINLGDDEKDRLHQYLSEKN